MMFAPASGGPQPALKRIPIQEAKAKAAVAAEEETSAVAVSREAARPETQGTTGTTQIRGKEPARLLVGLRLPAIPAWKNLSKAPRNAASNPITLRSVNGKTAKSFSSHRRETTSSKKDQLPHKGED